MSYKRIGDFIELVDERNRDLSVTTLLGLSISKQFIPSVANTIGTNMKTYKIIRKNQFACSVMQVRRDGKMPVALLKEFDEAIISQAYPVFQVIDETELLPEYLMMWFTRAEFDREATFHAVGGVRGSLEWEDFLDFELPIPSLEKQQQIVAEYNTVTNRINLNNQLNQKLEETAQALYKNWFVDYEFPNAEGKPYKSSGGEMVYNEELDTDIPVGWRVETIGEKFDIKIGRTPPRNEKQWFSTISENNTPWVSIKDLGQCKSYLLDTNEYLTKEAIEKFSIPVADENTTFLSFKMSIGKVGITTTKMLSNEAIAHFNTPDKTYTEFIFLFLKQFNFNSLGTTSSIVNSTTLLQQLTLNIVGRKRHLNTIQLYLLKLH